MKKKLLVFCILMSSSFSEAATEKIVIIAERRSRDGREQSSLHLEKDGSIRVTNNSDLLFRNRDRVSFGLWKGKVPAKTREMLTALPSLVTAEARIHTDKPMTHDLHVYVNGVSVSPNSPSFGKVVETLKTQLSRRDLKAESSETIDRKTAKSNKDCVPLQPEARVCRTRLGIVHY